MHPTRTTTKLLLGVACAVSAVSGCVHVTPAPMQPARAPGTAAALPRHVPRGGPAAAPVEVQAPALEALKAVPGRSAQPAAPAGGRQSAPGGAAVPAIPAGGAADPLAAGPSRAVPPVPDIPEPRRPARRASAGKDGHRNPSGPEAEVPRELMKELPVRPSDVCALGRRHGRWHPDSPEARICGGVQGG
ncbi:MULTISPECIES: hypothetical protein [unclassified Streptomyces]|uniref:hypothetical protein n=1 Tax=unclassified Streptomyces TaxID=2593676 RepID=UPI002E0FDC05|nr:MULTISPECIES: hypothetical protein [unclassified Streptomyces]WSR24893.1 hypothetical protein OG573_01300 [Streptomyces sp. NBC_01205]